ncbi:MAG: hypothetical protein GF308_14030 [Candidatus Heimdallarchaeota archaeon]|nr:hypothetical protein [Candidatus Heimdallarchaeota archaeon]
MSLVRQILRNKLISFAVILLFVSLSFSSSMANGTILDNYQDDVASQLAPPINDRALLSPHPSEKSLVVDKTLVRSSDTMFLEDDLLFLVDYQHGLEIYNISNPEIPFLVTSYPSLDLDYDSKLVLHGDYLYISTDHFGAFYILERINSSSFIEKAFIINLPKITDFAIKDGHLHAINETSYFIYTLSNYTSLELLSVYQRPNVFLREFTLYGSYSFILDQDHGFSVYNVTNPAEIQLAYDLFLGENIHFPSLVINDSTLLLSESSVGLHIFDLSDLLSPSLITTNNLVKDLDLFHLSENYLFTINNDDNNLQIFDGSNLTAIRYLGSCSIDDYTVSFRTIVMQDNYLYLHNIYTGELQLRLPIHIINIANPGSPLHIFPTVNKYGFSTWLIPLVISIVVLIIAAPTILLGIFLVAYFTTKKKTAQKDKSS